MHPACTAALPKNGKLLAQESGCWVTGGGVSDGYPLQLASPYHRTASPLGRASKETRAGAHRPGMWRAGREKYSLVPAVPAMLLMPSAEGTAQHTCTVTAHHVLTGWGVGRSYPQRPAVLKPERAGGTEALRGC